MLSVCQTNTTESGNYQFYFHFVINCVYFVGVKCKICKFRYHKGCLAKIPLHCMKNVTTEDNDSTLDGKLC